MSNNSDQFIRIIDEFSSGILYVAKIYLCSPQLEEDASSEINIIIQFHYLSIVVLDVLKFFHKVFCEVFGAPYGKLNSLLEYFKLRRVYLENNVFNFAYDFIPIYAFFAVLKFRYPFGDCSGLLLAFLSQLLASLCERSRTKQLYLRIRFLMMLGILDLSAQVKYAQCSGGNTRPSPKRRKPFSQALLVCTTRTNSEFIKLRSKNDQQDNYPHSCCDRPPHPVPQVSSQKHLHCVPPARRNNLKARCRFKQYAILGPNPPSPVKCKPNLVAHAGKGGTA